MKAGMPQVRLCLPPQTDDFFSPIPCLGSLHLFLNSPSFLPVFSGCYCLYTCNFATMKGFRWAMRLVLPDYLCSNISPSYWCEILLFENAQWKVAVCMYNLFLWPTGIDCVSRLRCFLYHKTVIAARCDQVRVCCFLYVLLHIDILLVVWLW